MILVGCEESQTVTKAFRGLGCEAFSCDLEPTRGNPEWHYQMDIKQCIKTKGPFDLIILHPDCTRMAVCNNRRCAKGKPQYQGRMDDVEWTVDLWELAKENSPKVVLENPASVIFPVLRKLGAKIQYIQPHQFGHGETKKTGLALYGVPDLRPTNEVKGREQRIWKMAPGPNRKRDRSVTFQGVADAMAEQWGL